MIYIPKQTIYIILGTIWLYGFIKNFTKLFSVKPGKRTTQRLKIIKDIGKEEVGITQIIAEFLKPIFEYIEKKITISKYDRMTLERNLKRVGSTDTPEIHVAKKYIYPLILFVLGIVISMLFSSSIIFSLMTFVSVIAYFVPDSELNKKIKIQNDKVLSELPRFVSTIECSPNSKTMFRIVEDYLKVAFDGLYGDLKIWYDKVKMNADEKDEFLNFADRVGIPEVHDVVQTIISSMDVSNDNARTMLKLLGEKIRRLNVDNIRKEFKKRPEQLDIINTILIYLLTALFGVPVIIEIIEIYLQTFK